MPHLGESFTSPKSSEGLCPFCGSAGRVADPCTEKACRRHSYHLIPASYVPETDPDEPPLLEPMIGRMISDYLVVDLLGTGGFGKVFKALQTPIMMEAALKQLCPGRGDQATSETFARNFEREAAALASLTHPNVVRLLKYGVDGARPYLVMEFVDGGRTLEDEIGRLVTDERGMGPGTVSHIFRQLLNALETAHALDIVHRDLKPGNIMLQEVAGDPYFVKVLDFGLAKFTKEGELASMTIGTPIYMAPEQVTRKNGIGPWTDLYALAVMLFELMLCELTIGEKACAPQEPWLPQGRDDGAAGLVAIPALAPPALVCEANEELPGAPSQREYHPFAGQTTEEILWKKMDPSFDPARQLDELDLEPAVLDFFRKGLAREPEDRFRSVAEFRPAMEAMFAALEEDPSYAAVGEDIRGLVNTRDVEWVRVEREKLERDKRKLKDDHEHLQTATKRFEDFETRRRRSAGRIIVGLIVLVAALTAIVTLFTALRSSEDRVNTMTDGPAEASDRVESESD